MFVGVMVYGRTGETTLDDPCYDDPCYDDLFSTAAALDQPIFIHPQIPTPNHSQVILGHWGELLLFW